VFFCERLPGWICSRLQRRIDVDREGLIREIAQVRERFIANLGATMFVLVPAFSLLLMLAYANRRMRYTEHLVFALHLHAFWFLAMGVMLSSIDALELAAMVAVPWYALAAMRRVYGGRRWPRLLRAMAVGALYALTLVLAMSGLALWSLLT
jgi:hypothetical protein